MTGFPPEHCRVVEVRTDGDDAYVLLDTGPRGQPYLYGVSCKRQNGRWFDHGSANGPGWSQTDQAKRLGTLTAWGEAPADGDMVRFELNGHVVEEPVVEGAYLAAWWRQPESGPDAAWPDMVAFRIRGQWAPQSSWRGR